MVLTFSLVFPEHNGQVDEGCLEIKPFSWLVVDTGNRFRIWYKVRKARN